MQHGCLDHSGFLEEPDSGLLQVVVCLRLLLGH